VSGGGGGGSTGPTAAETALSRVASESFARQKALYDPIISKYVKNAGDSTTPVNQARGLANVSTQAAFSAATPQVLSRSMAFGGNPSAAISNLGVDRTQSQALGQGAAIGAGKNLQLARLNTVIGFGRGTAQQAATGLGQTAQAAQEQAELDAEIAANQRAQIGSAVLGAGGLAFGLAGKTPGTTTTDFKSPDFSNLSYGLGYGAPTTGIGP
jgi:hypothetical protein